MKKLLSAMAYLACATTAAVAGDVTVSIANGTNTTFESVTVYAMDGGEVLDTALGATEKSLRPGRTAKIALELDACAPVFVQALFGAKGIVTTEADSCDRAIFTLTE